ncbi:unnamed protein product [Caenorhabditis brenneri]
MFKRHHILLILASIMHLKVCLAGSPNKHLFGETHWQLFNRCSHGMLQSFLGSINTRGYPDKHCLTDWNVIGDWDGKFRLQHANSKKYICFNKRARITLRINGMDMKCKFVEEIHENGYSRIRSSWRTELFLGFNERGKFQRPSSSNLKPRCFDWIKFVRYVPVTEKTTCSTYRKSSPRQTFDSPAVYNVVRSNFLRKVSAS